MDVEQEYVYLNSRQCRALLGWTAEGGCPYMFIETDHHRD
jgi:hypothetical protein